MKTYYLQVLLCLCMTLMLETFASNRVKRLVWPPGGDKIQMIAGVGIPVDLEEEKLIFGMVYKASYALPNNVTQLQYSNTIYQRNARSLENSHRNTIEYLERFLYVQNQYSKDCVLRTICEAAVPNFDENAGLMNEIMNIIFGSMEQTLRHHDDQSYIEALNLGIKNPEECKLRYSKCRSSFMNIISKEHHSI